jgi:hypothetical protein
MVATPNRFSIFKMKGAQSMSGAWWNAETRWNPLPHMSKRIQRGQWEWTLWGECIGPHLWVCQQPVVRTFPKEISDTCLCRRP